MNRGSRGNVRGTRHVGNRADRGARPDAGRGNIVSGSRTQEIRRRREHRDNVGLGRGPQAGRSLADRMTFGHGGQGGGLGAQRTRALADRITFDNGGAPQNDLHARTAAQRARPLVDRISTDTSRNSGATSHDAQDPSLFVSSQPNQTRFERQASTLSSSSLFNEVATAAPAPPATTRISAPASTPAIRVVNEKPKPKSKRFRVCKDPINRLVSNANLRNMLAGKRPPKPPKRHDQMLLRMGKAAPGLEGYELVCNSPAHN
ncbi:hypothetical protein N0V90_007409 [Kalmusia sp. IMI 367209]|nr:hypothetical protein N0V90_007409 [Kalmusia sp. IMI 367209]